MHVDWIWANDGNESKWWRKCIKSKCEIGMKCKLTWGVELKLSVKVTWNDPHNGSLFKGMITAWEFHVKKPVIVQLREATALWLRVSDDSWETQTNSVM